MKAMVNLQGDLVPVDLSKPIDISIPYVAGADGPRAWYVDPIKIEPVRTDQFLGSVSEGGNVNFRNIYFNPHGHGTHTESVGHIAEKIYSVNTALENYFFEALVITLTPETPNHHSKWVGPEDSVITRKMLQEAIGPHTPDALVIRTLPNGQDKKTRNYSATNPPYFLTEALEYIAEQNVKHLLTDLPSVDREEDGGELLGHRAFWMKNGAPDLHKTITEFIYVDSSIVDGTYLLNLQVAPFENDASPSRPVLYAID